MTWYVVYAGYEAEPEDLMQWKTAKFVVEAENATEAEEVVEMENEHDPNFLGCSCKRRATEQEIQLEKEAEEWMLMASEFYGDAE